MKSIRWLVALLALVVGTTVAVRAAETLDNNAILEMHKLGLGDPVLIEKIQNSPGKYDTGLEELKKLKAAGISDEVIKAMIATSATAKPTAAVPASAAAAVPLGDPNDPKAMHSSGIYLSQEAGGKQTLTKLQPSTFDSVSTGGGWGMAWGGSAKTRSALSDTHAKLQLSGGTPVFYFYFDANENALSSSENKATSPEDFVLAELEIKDSKSERRLVIGKAGMGGAKFGLDKKAIRPVQSEKVAENIYKVWPTAALKPGEYCFVYSQTKGMAGPSKVFDFGVK